MPPVAQTQGLAGQCFECRVYWEEYDVSLLAPSLDVFSKEKICAIARDDVVHFLGLPRHLYHANEYAFSPYGICMEIPVIPLSLYLPLDSIQFDGNQDDLYLAVLGCETASHPGHLLTSFCCIPSSSYSSVQFLYGGTVDVFQGNTLINSLIRLFPLSPATLERCRQHICVKTVYISHCGRTTDTLETTCDWQHNDIRLVLPEEQKAALSARGCTVDLCAPSHDHVEDIHLLMICKDTHVIVIEY